MDITRASTKNKRVIIVNACFYCYKEIGSLRSHLNSRQFTRVIIRIISHFHNYRILVTQLLYEIIPINITAYEVKCFYCDKVKWG